MQRSPGPLAGFTYIRGLLLRRRRGKRKEEESKVTGKGRKRKGEGKIGKGKRGKGEKGRGQAPKYFGLERSLSRRNRCRGIRVTRDLNNATMYSLSRSRWTSLIIILCPAPGAFWNTIRYEMLF